MIATHSPKMYNARIQSSAVTARIEGQVPACLICSQTTDMRREMWAAPTNAAEIKEWREAAEKLPNDFVLEPRLPGIADPQLKQLLVPADGRNDRYISITPVPSMGVIHEVYQRLHEQKLPFRKWIIQPTPAAIANHGEALLMQSGAVRMLRQGPTKITQGRWRGEFVQLTARCEKMNISSGMLAVGLPAITAIGGFIHSLERKTGQDIAFAVGVKSSDFVSGVPKVTTYKTSYGPASGRAQGGTVNPVPGYSTEEIVANCEIVLLLKSKAHSAELMDMLANTHRLAGGRLFDVDVSVIADGIPPDASYLLDASSDIARKRKEGMDSLQAALEMYAMDGRRVDGEWHQPRNGYTLNQTGYAFLERPVNRKGARGNYPHVWAEPTFSLIAQDSMSESCWWSKNSNESGVFWTSRGILNDGNA